MEHTTYRSKKGVCTMAVDFSKSKTRGKFDAGICRRESGKESLYNCGKAGES
mgnify:CR=1 FL=1